MRLALTSYVQRPVPFHHHHTAIMRNLFRREEGHHTYSFVQQTRAIFVDVFCAVLCGCSPLDDIAARPWSMDWDLAVVGQSY